MRSEREVVTKMNLPKLPKLAQEPKHDLDCRCADCSFHRIARAYATVGRVASTPPKEK